MTTGDHVHITPEAVRMLCTTPDPERSDDTQAFADAIMDAIQDCEICDDIFTTVSEQVIAECTSQPFESDGLNAGGVVDV